MMIECPRCFSKGLFYGYDGKWKCTKCDTKDTE